MWLAQMTQQDFFESMTHSLDDAQQTGRALALAALCVLLLGVLVALQVWRRRQAVPQVVNHHGRLEKEVAGRLRLDAAEIRELAAAAAEQGLSSPLALLLCPSLLGRAITARTGPGRETLRQIAKRLEAGATTN